jgi:flagellum-specific peptidoglycan hydrolase FlgJ
MYYWETNNFRKVKLTIQINAYFYSVYTYCMRALLLLFLILSTRFIQAQSVAEIYIGKYNSLALEVMNTYGIPASLVLGIAMQESASGNSKLCQLNHNHFGVKQRVKSSKTKSGYKTVYRKFESDEAAYLHFGEMLSRMKYYTTLKDDMNYLKWLKAMKKAKYATSSSWISHVDKMIKRYDLTCYDRTTVELVIPVSSMADTISNQQK